MCNSMDKVLKTSDIDYELPEELIARFPSDRRDDCRMMVLDCPTKQIEHKKFYDITDYLKAGDYLVLNDTRVIPARFLATKESGSQLELIFLNFKDKNPRMIEVISNKYRKLKLGQKIFLHKKKENHQKNGEGLDNLKAMNIIDKEELDSFPGEILMEGKIYELLGEGRVLLNLSKDLTFHEMEEIGTIPIPPYIRKLRGDYAEDQQWYQTIFARNLGSVASPTAALHFSEEIVNKLLSNGIKIIYITLHISWGTFKPISVEIVQDHQMEAEWFEISPQAANLLNQALKEDARIIAVGTTVTRVLEGACQSNNGFKPCSGWSDLFIYPGFAFKVINGLITNFHTPQSTPLLLVGAFAGMNLIEKAYKIAIEQKYRFFSYGDAMLLFNH